MSQRGTLRDQALVSLKLRREQLQAAIRNARGQSLANQRLTQEALLQLARLKELFNEEKKKLQGCEAEGEALRFSAEGAEESASASEAGLRDERERRYAHIGDLDAEQQRLLAEIVRLRSVLRKPAAKSSA